MPVPPGPFIGYASDFGDASVSAGPYVTVGHCVNIDTPDYKVGDADASYVQMPNRYKIFVPKLTDPGEVKFKLIWSPAAYTHIQGLLGTYYYYFQVTFPDLGATASTLKFQGYYKELTAPMPLEDLVVCDVTVKVSGTVTFTAGT